jgi:hypothetical protein
MLVRPCGRFPGSFQVVEGKAVLSILLAVSNVILGWQWHGHADLCSKRSYRAGSWNEAARTCAYDFSTPAQQLSQASYHRPDDLTPSLELIPPHLLKINTSHAIPVPERDSSLKRVVDTPVCHFTVFPASKRVATLKIPYLF